MVTPERHGVHQQRKRFCREEFASTILLANFNVQMPRKPGPLFEILREQVLETPYHLSWPQQLACRNEATWTHRQVFAAATRLAAAREIVGWEEKIFSKGKPELMLRPSAYSDYAEELSDMRRARREMRKSSATAAIGAWGETIAYEWLQEFDLLQHPGFQVTASGDPVEGATEPSFDFVFDGIEEFGLEVKNRLSPFTASDAKKIVELAKKMQVRPVIMARRVERDVAKRFAKAKGLMITWGVQFVPEWLREPAEVLIRTYGLPMYVGRPSEFDIVMSTEGFRDMLNEEYGIEARYDLEPENPLKLTDHVYRARGARDIGWRILDRETELGGMPEGVETHEGNDEAP